MNEKKYNIINLTTLIITVLIACIFPLDIKNVFGFAISLIIYVAYSIFGLYFNKKIKDDRLHHNIKNIPMYTIYYLGLVILYILLILNKIIYINISILIIIYLIIGIILFSLLYALYLGISKLKLTENKIKEKTNYHTTWITELELFLKEKNIESVEDIKKVYELIKYSDPLSNDLTKEIDEKISLNINELCQNKKYKLVATIEKLVNKRNSIISNDK